MDEEGNLYVTVKNVGNGNVGIVKFDANGVHLKTFDSGLSNTANDFRGIAARGGEVFVATDGRSIRVYDASLTALKRTIGRDDSTDRSYRAVAFDNDGNLYAVRQTGTGATEVRRWLASQLSGSGTVLFSTTSINLDPRAIAVDNSGNIYITLNNPKVVRKFDQSGHQLADISPPSGTGTLIGLGYDPPLDTFYAVHTDTGGIGQLLKFTPSDTSATAFGPNDLSGARWLAVYPTPEPATWLLFGVGAGAALWRWRRQRR